MSEQQREGKVKSKLDAKKNDGVNSSVHASSRSSFDDMTSIVNSLGNRAAWLAVAASFVIIVTLGLGYQGAIWLKVETKETKDQLFGFVNRELTNDSVLVHYTDSVHLLSHSARPFAIDTTQTSSIKPMALPQPTQAYSPQHHNDIPSALVYSLVRTLTFGAAIMALVFFGLRTGRALFDQSLRLVKRQYAVRYLMAVEKDGQLSFTDKLNAFMVWTANVESALSFRNEHRGIPWLRNTSASAGLTNESPDASFNVDSGDKK